MKQFLLFAVVVLGFAATSEAAKKPNILFLLTDQWRASALGYAGDPNVKTPNIDQLASQSVNFTHAVSGMPVCCPYRATLMTGQRPLTHGVFMNDVQLNPKANSIGKLLTAAGYDTAYIGKWHIDGRGRSSFIPKERRQGFEYWKVLECTHNYNNSFYYDDEPVKKKWPGYDSIAQALDAQTYIKKHAKSDKPFAMFLSWGTPHAPYQTAPKNYRAMYDPAKIKLRPNVPEKMQAGAKKNLAGYYAHCSALDDLIGQLRKTLKDAGIEKDTIVIFTADHGDMLGSHGAYKKQRPHDESIRIPMLWHYPRELDAMKTTALMNSEDIMPTLLGLCGIEIPKSVEGTSYQSHLLGGQDPSGGAALITCIQPFGQWSRSRGGQEYRGLRTKRYTYTRNLKGPWHLFDNETDPYQMDNLVGKAEHAKLQAKLEAQLTKKLAAQKDEFKSGPDYLAKWNYKVNKSGTVPYRN
jgi:arylsulfatase A-like enzyme